MEELEAVTFLPPSFALPILSAFYKDNKYYETKNVGVHHHLIVTGGAQGILKFFSVYLKVIFSPSLLLPLSSWYY